MTFRIVPIGKEHVAQFRAAVDSVAKERLYLAMLKAPTITEITKFVLDNLAAGTPQFVAIADDKVVGWCDVLPKPRPTLKHSGVLGMGVIEPYRGRGIGKSLLEATLQAAKAKGLNRIELTVRSDNTRAKKLYEALGFVVEGLCKHHMYVDEGYVDSYLMALLFDGVMPSRSP